MREVLVQCTSRIPGPAGLPATGLRSAVADVAVPDGVFVAVAEPGAGAFGTARAYASEHGLVWLPVQAGGGWVLIGPVVRPGIPGCPTCLGRRRDGNRADTAERRALAERYGPESGDPRLLPLVSRVITALLAGEVAHGFPRTVGGLLRVCARTAAVTSHRLLADPLCPDCGNRPDDLISGLDVIAVDTTCPELSMDRDLRPSELNLSPHPFP